MKKLNYPLSELWTPRTLSTHLAAILDIDGTIADNSHRKHFIPRYDASEKEKEYGWRDYQAYQPDDKFFKHVWHMYCYLTGKYSTARRIILSGRNESARLQTVEWLRNHSVDVDELYLRRDGDHRSNEVVKLEMLDKLRRENITPYLAFEDNLKTCQMFLAQKIHVYHCQNGVIVPFIIEKKVE